MPPCARHVVFTLIDSMMGGFHFFSWTQLERSVTGLIQTTFAGQAITNAEHPEFVSVLQSCASFWWPALSKNAEKIFSARDLGKYSQQVKWDWR